MKIKLLNEPNDKWNAVEQVMYNRGIKEEDFSTYFHGGLPPSPPQSLGIETLQRGVAAILSAIQQGQKAVVIVDCDCDGYTAAALLINYLYKISPLWVENNLTWKHHKGKSHGLSEHIQELLDESPALVIVPDAGSNDYEEHKLLKENGSTVLVLDHHLADHISEDAIVINNQLSDYPNKELSGVGVTWLFCKFFDSVVEEDYADDFIDLVALGNCGDMMSLLSFETRWLIFEGFKKDNIKNPFIDYMLDKNSFSLNKVEYKSIRTGQACTSIGAAFFIVPFINAVTRSGTLDEKEITFLSMLNHRAFERIPEVKRNKPTGKEEPLVLRAMRVVTNVKNRQTREEKAGLQRLESYIERDNMLDNQMLLFILEPNEVPNEIRGLIANKMMAKYQRPCAILTKGKDGLYAGSMRGYTKTGIASFKDVLGKAEGVEYCEGHDNAAGLGVRQNSIEDFLKSINLLLKNYSTEPLYYVDYFFDENNKEDGLKIIDISRMNDFWGQNFDRSKVAVRCKVTPDNFQILKSNTLKIALPNNISLIKFRGTEEDIEQLTTKGWKEVVFYGSCNVNEWNGYTYPQIMVEDFKVVDSCKYIF